MTILDNALEWIKKRTGGTYSMPPPMEPWDDDDWIPEKGHRVHAVDPPKKDEIIRANTEKKRTATRLPTKQEIEAMLIKCTYCGVSQFLDKGYCVECGGDLPEPELPEIIVEEKTVYVDREPQPSVAQPSFFSVAMSTGTLTDIEVGGVWNRDE